MARRLANPPRAATRVAVVPLESAQVIEVGPGDAAWGDPDDLPPCAGAFVVVKPPADADDAAVEAMRSAVEAAGPRALRVMPRPRGQVVPRAKQAATRSRAGLRQVVEELVAAANTKDRPALAAAVEEALAGAGL